MSSETKGHLARQTLFVSVLCPDSPVGQQARRPVVVRKAAIPSLRWSWVEIGVANPESPLMRLLKEKSWDWYTQVHPSPPSDPNPPPIPAREANRVSRYAPVLAALSLLLASCSGVDSGLGPVLRNVANEVTCGWEAQRTVQTSEPPGACWAPADPDIAVTPASVTDPCEVDAARLAHFASGESVTVWQPDSLTPDKRDLRLVPIPCEESP